MEVVSREVGVSVATLERWRAGALAEPAGEQVGADRWTAAARLEAVIATAPMDATSRSAWCRKHGIYLADLEAWKRDALGGLEEPRGATATDTRQDRAAERTDATQSGQPARRRIKELERELHRKDKALAETAALLVMRGKPAAVFRDGEDA